MGFRDAEGVVGRWSRDERVERSARAREKVRRENGEAAEGQPVGGPASAGRPGPVGPSRRMGKPVQVQVVLEDDAFLHLPLPTVRIRGAASQKAAR
jgi:hypothetical protein